MTSVNPDIFKAYDIRGKVRTELNADVCRRIGSATAQWLPAQGIVAVGRDMRPDSKELADALIDGLRHEGRDVWDIGQVTSDMIYFAVGNYDFAGGLVVTASHNTGDYNGIKIYRDEVTPVGLETGLAEIRDIACDMQPDHPTGSLEQKDIVVEWVRHCMALIHPASWPRYRIAVDAGNGMAGAILPRILPELPLEVEEMYFELDGTFPNHEANPQNHDNLKDLIEAVKKNKYDFGIAFDGDGDRAAFVDDLGRPVLGTDLISIVSKYMLDLYPESQIVHDVRTSRATQELIREWGGTPVRTKAGRVYIGALVRAIGAKFGGETTGHLFFADNYDADSGLLAALVTIQALAKSGKKMSELVDEYRRYVMPQEMNYKVEDKDLLIHDLKELFKDEKIDELDGLTVDMDDAWFNIRASNTEPVVRLNIEATTQQLLDEVLAKIESTLNKG